MDIKEFISSGILESYLLGSATQQEIDLVNDMKKKYPEVNDEIIKIENMLLGVAASGQPDLNAQTKKNIMSSIQDKGKTSSIPMLPAANKNILYYKYGIAATIGLFLISSIINVVYFGKVNKMNSELSRISKENVQMASEMGAQQASMKEMNDQFAVLADPSSKGILMKGLDISPASLAKVFWNSNSSEVYLMISELPEPPTDKQYQLWAIVDGKPVDAGVFDMNNPGKLQKMKNISAPQAFAVTLENKGGSTVPTMEAMYVIGNV